MPGIAGVIEKSERLTGDAAGRLIARLAGPAERVAQHAAGRAAMASARHVQASDNGGLSGGAGLLVAATGWIAGQPQLWRALDAQPIGHDAGRGFSPDSADSDAGRDLATLCRELYRQRGPDGLTELNGIYAVAVWDEREGTLVLAQDRIGAGGLCYLIEAGRFAFATRPRALIECRTPELDSRALGHLLTVGYPLGDRTLFRDVRMLGPASLGIWRDGRMLVRRTWSPPAPAEPGAAGMGDEEEAIENLTVALGHAVGDAVEGIEEPTRLVLPLSGGLDSRTLLGHARRRLRPSTYSYGHGHSWDRRFGARAARVAGARHRQIELQRDYIARYGPRLVYLTEGQASIHAAHILCLMPHVARRPAVVMSGYLGDALTGGHLGWTAPDGDPAAPAASVEAVTAQGTALFERAYRVGFDDAALGQLLRRPFAREARGAALEDFLEVYRQGVDPISRADCVDLGLRQRRFIAYQLSVLGAVAPVRAPFADHRVMDTCLAWPVAWRRRQSLYRRYIRHAHPDLARVPVTSTGLPLAGPPLWMALRRQAEHIRWRLLPRLSRGSFRPHDYRQYAHYDRWIRTGARGFFTVLLDDRELLDEVFDTERVSDLLKAHLEGRLNAYQELCAVATVGLWLRFFVRGRAAAAAEPVSSPAAAS